MAIQGHGEMQKLQCTIQNAVGSAPRSVQRITGSRMGKRTHQQRQLVMAKCSLSKFSTELQLHHAHVSMGVIQESAVVKQLIDCSRALSRPCRLSTKCYTCTHLLRLCFTTGMNTNGGVFLLITAVLNRGCSVLIGRDE